MIVLCSLWSHGDSFVLFEASSEMLQYSCTIWPTLLMSDLHGSDHWKMKALELQWVCETRVKTWSLCSHDACCMPKQILFWIPSPLSLSSSASAANYIIKTLQFLFPPSPEWLITPQWQSNRPTKAQIEMAHVLVHVWMDEGELLMSGRYSTC